MARRKPGQLVHFEHEVLEVLAGEPSGAMTVGEIQERTQVTTRSVVRILARLRAAGWVSVEWDADPLAPPAGGVRDAVLAVVTGAGVVVAAAPRGDRRVTGPDGISVAAP